MPQSAKTSKGAMKKVPKTNLGKNNEDIAKNSKSAKSIGAKNEVKNKETKSKSNKALYDAKGIHIASGKNLCDCLLPGCSGCFYPCEKCGSPMCGMVCRCNRDFVYDATRYESASSHFLATFKNLVNNSYM